MRRLFVVLAAACCLPPAAAFNKCINDAGDAVTYTDAPCTAESQPANARENTVKREPVDRQRFTNAQAEAYRRAWDLQQDHARQHDHAVQMRNRAEAEERERAARNSTVGPIVPRTDLYANPIVGGPWYPR